MGEETGFRDYEPSRGFATANLEGLAVLGIWDTAGALSGLQVDAPFRVGILLSNVAWDCKWFDDSMVRWPLLRSAYRARRQ